MAAPVARPGTAVYIAGASRRFCGSGGRCTGRIGSGVGLSTATVTARPPRRRHALGCSLCGPVCQRIIILRPVLRQIKRVGKRPGLAARYGSSSIIIPIITSRGCVRFKPAPNARAAVGGHLRTTGGRPWGHSGAGCERARRGWWVRKLPRARHSDLKRRCNNVT